MTAFEGYRPIHRTFDKAGPANSKVIGLGNSAIKVTASKVNQGIRSRSN